MEVGTDPTFTTATWTPVAATATVTPAGQGYQIVFARFRAPDGAVSPVSVDGVTLDATYAEATASVAGLHRASWVRPLSSTVVIMRIEAGRLERGVAQPYALQRPPPGDRVEGRFPRFWRWEGVARVQRDGKPFGRQVAGNAGLLRPYDRLLGRPLPIEELLAGPWRITSGDDPAYGGGLAPTGLERTSRPSATGQGPDGLVVPVVHDIAIELPEPLLAGHHYRIEPPGDLIEPYDLAVERFTISPAVHVNQHGYGTDDELKVAYLSAPLPAMLPTGLTLGYGAGMAFQVVDAATGRPALSGSTTARPGGAELGRGDLTGTPVYELDFSRLDQAGRYQVCVAGVGCSEAFPVTVTAWRDLAVIVARAMYQQRSGIAQGPPYTSIARPRPRHSDDGNVVRDSSFRLIDGSEDQAAAFAGLVAGRLPGVVPGAWGGHFDAGDWDRRIQHLYYARAVAEVVEARPQLFGQLDLDLPESGDAVPDLLDEALWSLDLYRRMQGPDGSIRGGVEASEHPQPDNTSWTDSLALFAYAPDPWSSYLYAGVAAELAHSLAAYDPARADGYLQSARAAMRWAEAQGEEPAQADQIRAERSVAAAALLQATGERQWNNVFLDATDLDQGVDRFLSCHEHGRCDAAWIYWTTDPALTDPAVRALAGDSIVATAEEIVAGAETTSFGWTVENTSVPLIWGLGAGGTPHVTALVRAAEVSGEGRFRQAAERSAAVALGANPLNTVFITGVGQQPVRSPLIVDADDGGLPVWPGTPVYGPHQLAGNGAEDWIDGYVLGPAGTRPLARQLPYLWQWFDVSNVAQFNEFTVYQSHADALYAFAMLAGPAGS
jgi:endoglucanase